MFYLFYIISPVLKQTLSLHSIKKKYLSFEIMMTLINKQIIMHGNHVFIIIHDIKISDAQ